MKILFQVIVYTVAALSVERYIDARSLFTPRSRIFITLGTVAFIWALGFLLPFPFMVFTYLDTGIESNSSNMTNSTNTVYSCQSHLSEKQLLVHEIILYIVAFLIPYCIIVTFSLKLLKFLRDWLKRKEKLTRTIASRRRTRGVKLVLCIVLSFLICFTPFWAFKFYTRYVVHESVEERPFLKRVLFYIHSLVVVLNHFEGVLNPLFFILLTERFCSTFSKHRKKSSRLHGAKQIQFKSIARPKIAKSTVPTTTIVRMTNGGANELLITKPETLEKVDNGSIL